MNTMKALKWAFDTPNLLPEERLMAIYIATIVNQDGIAEVDETKAAEWCGFVSSARRVARLGDVRGAVQSLPGIIYEYHEGGKIYISMVGDGK